MAASKVAKMSASVTGDSSLDEDSGFADPILLNKPFVFEEVKAVVSKLLESPAS